MAEVVCPNCAAQIPPAEVANGWCESCGKQIPPFALAAAEEPPPPAPSPRSDDLPSPARDRPEPSREGFAIVVPYQLFAVWRFFYYGWGDGNPATGCFLALLLLLPIGGILSLSAPVALKVGLIAVIVAFGFVGVTLLFLGEWVTTRCPRCRARLKKTERMQKDWLGKSIEITFYCPSCHGPRRKW